MYSEALMFRLVRCNVDKSSMNDDFDLDETFDFGDEEDDETMAEHLEVLNHLHLECFLDLD